MTEHTHDHDDLASACEVAHGTAPAPVVSAAPGERILVAVFASPVSGYLLRYGTDLGYRGFLVEPDEGRAAGRAALGFPLIQRPTGRTGPQRRTW